MVAPFVVNAAPCGKWTDDCMAWLARCHTMPGIVLMTIFRTIFASVAQLQLQPENCCHVNCTSLKEAVLRFTFSTTGFSTAAVKETDARDTTFLKEARQGLKLPSTSATGGGGGSSTTTTSAWLHKADSTQSRARPKNVLSQTKRNSGRHTKHLLQWYKKAKQ